MGNVEAAISDFLEMHGLAVSVFNTSSHWPGTSMQRKVLMKIKILICIQNGSQATNIFEQVISNVSLHTTQHRLSGCTIG